MPRARQESETRNNGASVELVKSLDAAINRLAELNAIEGVSPVLEVIDAARALMFNVEGLEALYERARMKVHASGCRLQLTINSLT